MAVFAFGKSVVHALAAVAVSLAAGSAQATVVYQGAWDPAFGPDFPGMGWRAQAQVEIPTLCVTALGGFSGVLDGIAGNDFTDCRSDYSGFGGIRLKNLKMQFYALPAGASQEFYEAVNEFSLFSAVDGGCTSVDCFESLTFLNGKLVGLQTAFSSTLSLVQSGGGFASDITLTQDCGGGPSNRFSTDFDFSLRVGANVVSGVGGGTSTVAANLFGECFDGTSSFQPTTVKLVEVPEPGSVPLVLGALGALAAMTRLRRGARSGR